MKKTKIKDLSKIPWRKFIYVSTPLTYEFRFAQWEWYQISEGEHTFFEAAALVATSTGRLHTGPIASKLAHSIHAQDLQGE